MLSERAIDSHSNLKNMNRGQNLSRRKSLIGSNSDSKMNNILGLKRQFSLDNNFMLGSAGKMKTTTPKDVQPYQMSPLGLNQPRLKMNHVPLMSMMSLPIHAQAVDL